MQECIIVYLQQSLIVVKRVVMIWVCGMETGTGQNYTPSQQALYQYWNTWVDAAGVSSSYKCSANYSARQ